MSWNNVLRLTGVYAKSSRLITKRNFRKFRERRWETYAIYGAAVVIGALLGLGAGYFYLMVPDMSIQSMLREAVIGFFVSLPTLCVLYTLFLTMMFQIQGSGVKASIQPIYWFPVTWEEHTAASAISSTLTGTLWLTALICSGVLTASALTGQLPLAIFTTLGLFLCMALTGLTIEAFKAVQMGVSGGVMKAAGRSAIWVRFFAMILMFTVAYMAYFAFIQSDMAAVFKAIGEGQLAAWFVPYVWPGIALYAFSQGQPAMAALFALGSVGFVAALFVIASRLNARYGLSDMAAIRVSSAYAPGTGLLGRLGLPAAESALMKKDFKAFTRRSELMYVFIMPIVIVVATFMPLFMGGRGPAAAMGESSTFYFLYLALMPAPMLAMTLGISVVGSEGERLWYLKASPVAAKGFVRAKFLFPAALSTAIAAVCCGAAFLIFGATLRTAATGLIEAVLLVHTVGIVALFCGIAGADFRELPRPRMIRTEWSLISMALSVAAGLLVLLPLLAYGGIAFLGISLPWFGSSGAFLYVAWLLSGVVALAISCLFYRASLRYARKLLDAAE